ncbi:MAG: energy transducer TonB [Candidatus Methylacidiphilales bacterium]|nr:energy transducer TonB [Candidatus Methylacidiphilales bacterium]
MRTIAVIAAVALHLAVLLFGGLLFNKSDEKKKDVKEVEIVAQEEDKEKKPEKKEIKKEEPPPEEKEEAPPDNSINQEIEQLNNPAPALAAISLSDLESALGGSGGMDSFGSGTSFASGGVIGGTGGPGGRSDMEEMLGSSDSVEPPQVVSTVEPVVPPSIRKTGGSVKALLFINDRGRVDKVVIEKASDSLLEGPVKDALMKWVFEPAKRDGKKSATKVAQSIRIPPSA